MKPLPEKLEDRIFSCDAGSFMQMYEMTPSDYSPIQISLRSKSCNAKYRDGETNYIIKTNPELMQELITYIQTNLSDLDILAVTNLNIGFQTWDAPNSFTHISGVGIVEERKYLAYQAKKEAEKTNPTGNSK